MKLLGYAWLVQQYQLEVIPNWHESILSSGASRTELSDGRVEEEYTAPYDPGEDVGAQFEFALKYDGTNLLILAKLFAKVSPEHIVEYVQSRPTGKYARRIWYLHELLTKTRLPLADLTQGNYVDLLDQNEYYTTARKRVQRQRIYDNLIGDSSFCPTIRRTKKLRELEQSSLGERCLAIMSEKPPELLNRALGLSLY